MPAVRRGRQFRRQFLGDRLAEELRRAIESGQLRPGEPIMSDRQLSQRYRISPASVQRALRKLADMGLVERRPRSGTFVGGERSQRSRVRSLARVVFYLPVGGRQHLNPYYAQMILEIERTLMGRGWDMIFSSLREPPDARSLLAREPEKLPEAGRILVGPAERVLGDRRVPYVFIDHRPEGDGADAALTDDPGGMHRAVECLVALGHRRIVYVGGLDDDEGGAAAKPWPNSVRREEAWRHAMRAAGIEADEAWSVAMPPVEKGGRAAFERLAKLQPSPTAAITFSTKQGAGLVSAAREAGLRVPDDFSVMAFGVVEEGAAPPRGELALLRPDVRALGSSGVDLLMRRIARPDALAREVLVPVELQDGATLGRAREDR